MNIIRLINILRGAIPKNYVNFRNYFLNLFILKPSTVKKTQVKKILLIRPDGIGDFVQWLPCAYAVKDYFKQQGFTLTLLGSSAWIDFAKELNIFDFHIGLNRETFLNSSDYRKKIIDELNKYSYEKVIHFAPSREFSLGDTIVKSLDAKEKIGIKKEHSNDSSFWFSISDNWYTKLISIKGLDIYEPEINEFFLKQLSIPTPQSNIPSIKLNYKKEFTITEEDYFIVIPGSNMNIKQWNFENFAKIIKLVLNNSSLKCMICGGNKELQLLEKNKDKIDFEYINMVAKTSLLELTELISKSKFVLTNDTGAVHFAAGVNKNAYCIYGGGHFGRFLPYKEEKNSERILPNVIYNKMECFNCNWKCRYQITKSKPAKCVESVSVEQVWNQIEKDLPSFKTAH